MTSEHDNPIQSYMERIKGLYDNIHIWLEGGDLNVSEQWLELNEEAYGRYRVQQLIVTDETGARIAEIRPVGASIIAAEGRVDIVGPLDKQIIVYLLASGPHISKSMIEGGRVSEAQERPLFSGVRNDGWYWIEEVRLGRARLLDKELFQDLLTEVSDHVFQ